MTSLCFYFQVHQPFRVRRFSIFDIGNEQRDYFAADDGSDLDNRQIIQKVAHKSYRPMNNLILSLLQDHSEFRASFSITGTVLEQLAEHAPDVIEQFQRMAETGRVEFLGESYYHSLAFLYSEEEFERQLTHHADAIEHFFGQRPQVFRNTELVYRNDLADLIARHGYKGALAEGADRVLDWRSPNYVYHAKDNPQLPLLLKNYKLSDDIAFRFGEQEWKEYPLTAEKFANWVNGHHGDAEVINLFMDYETFGEHQWEDTGIFDFMKQLPDELLRHPDTSFVTPSEAVERYAPVGEIDAPDYVSWADVERDLSAWFSNEMQGDALRSLYDMEEKVMESGDPHLIADWRYLTTSDHFYYMCTKWFADGDVHTYFSPFDTPYDAFISYMNVLHDVQLRLQRLYGEQEEGGVSASVSGIPAVENVPHY